MASILAGTARVSRLPVVVVLGATGTGKSKLALEIASTFKGEIISADSMQVYHGLDIITNKVTPEEQAQVPHHILDFLDPLSRFSVTDFRNVALPLVEKLLSNNKIPVIVGGTNYYIESLLWNVLIDSVPSGKEGNSKLVYERDKEIYGNIKRNSKSDDQCTLKKSKLSGATSDSAREGGKDGKDVKEKECVKCIKEGGDKVENGESKVEMVEKVVEGESESNSDEVPVKCAAAWQDTDITTEELYRRLQEVDPDIASQYHPNERRKIIRSLQVWEQTGQRHSQLLELQQQQHGGSRLGGGLRYPNTAIVWVTCQQEVLNKRLDDRVDEMIERGLLKELKDFHASYNAKRLKDGEAPDYTKGIFQSIGFKEFHNFLILPEEEQETDKGKMMYEAGVEAMKLATRQYTKKQLRWIRNRFLLPSGRQVPPVYALDGSDPSKWNEKVRDPAQAVVQALVDGTQPALEVANVSKVSEAQVVNKSDKTRHECTVCNRVVIGEHAWKAHMQGAKHRKMLNRKNVANEAAEISLSSSSVKSKT
nr:tRNA dimethylallyltransferase-like isoform X1 [Cherax quadricarinatus]